ncbi:MAG: hypothetical protein ACREQY_13990 [Candidatus Binatia bacterium]
MSVKGVLVLLILAAIGLFGWHLTFWGAVVDRVEELPWVQAVDKAVPVSVRLNPATNRVEVGLAILFAADPKNLISKLGSAVGVTIAAEYWPEEIEKELAAFAWEHGDLYAILVPYRAVVVEKK